MEQGQNIFTLTVIYLLISKIAFAYLLPGIVHYPCMTSLTFTQKSKNMEQLIHDWKVILLALSLSWIIPFEAFVAM